MAFVKMDFGHSHGIPTISAKFFNGGLPGLSHIIVPKA